MKPPRLRVPVSSLAQGRAVLDADTARYVARVHRLGRGDVFVAFDPRSAVEALATVVEAGATVTVDVGEIVAASSLPPARITLLQGVAKAGKLDDVVRDATELGVSRIVPVLCRRSQGGAPPRAERLQRVALEAARQCGRGDLPQIADAAPFGALEALVGVRVLMDPGAAQPFGNVVGPRMDEIALLVGPEGGLDDREIDDACRWGFLPVRLGPFVMRTETAASAALGAFWAAQERTVHA